MFYSKNLFSSRSSLWGCFSFVEYVNSIFSRLISLLLLSRPEILILQTDGKILTKIGDLDPVSKIKIFVLQISNNL